MMTVRSANKEDIEGILPLMAKLGYPSNRQELEKRFEAFLTLEGYGVAVCCNDAQIIGWVAWSKSIAFVLPKARIRIEGLIVDNAYHRQGVGKKLMAFVEGFAKNLSPCIIDLTSSLQRSKEGSHEFYKALGYHNDGSLTKVYLRKEV